MQFVLWDPRQGNHYIVTAAQCGAHMADDSVTVAIKIKQSLLMYVGLLLPETKQYWPALYRSYVSTATRSIMTR